MSYREWCGTTVGQPENERHTIMTDQLLAQSAASYNAYGECELQAAYARTLL